MTARVTLVLGGARSGKSRWAERLAAAAETAVLYVATATAGDDEMAARIAAHRMRRPAAWRTLEAPLDLPTAIGAHARGGELLLVDCLSLWVSNEMLRLLGPDGDPDRVPEPSWSGLEEQLVAAVEQAIAAARAAAAPLVLVSNEVGMGLVPPYPLGRRYRDALGRVNQAAAARADDVHLMVAGLPIDLRRLRPDVDPRRDEAAPG